MPLPLEKDDIPAPERLFAGQQASKLCPVISTGGFKPAASRKVGARSMRLTKSPETWPGFIFPGQHIARGWRVPPSYRLALQRGNGQPLSP